MAHLEQNKNLSTEFIDWFIGFVEGRGVFSSKWNNSINTHTPSFCLIYTDLGLLQCIQYTLGFGSVTYLDMIDKTPYGRIYEYSVNNRDEIQYLMELIYTHRRLDRAGIYIEYWAQWQQLIYDNYPSDLVLKYTEKTPPKQIDFNSSWFTGFLESNIILDAKSTGSQYWARIRSYAEFTHKYPRVQDVYVYSGHFCNTDKENQPDVTGLNKIKSYFHTDYSECTISNDCTYSLRFINNKSLDKLIDYLNEYPFKSKSNLQLYETWRSLTEFDLLNLAYDDSGLAQTASLNDMNFFSTQKKQFYSHVFSPSSISTEFDFYKQLHKEEIKKAEKEYRENYKSDYCGPGPDVEASPCDEDEFPLDIEDEYETFLNWSEDKFRRYLFVHKPSAEKY